MIRSSLAIRSWGVSRCSYHFHQDVAPKVAVAKVESGGTDDHVHELSIPSHRHGKRFSDLQFQGIYICLSTVCGGVWLRTKGDTEHRGFHSVRGRADFYQDVAPKVTVAKVESGGTDDHMHELSTPSHRQGERFSDLQSQGIYMCLSTGCGGVWLRTKGDTEVFHSVRRRAEGTKSW
ncbi:hypothetical protein BS47DRAFT_1342288 [Hydnum rufescens UP504]|uniref:Uncharacterized protein n=1 Tax=Hydnum rufescens UP504 TaxID=1448309 RepID=A0A9P6B0B6_9AGAM|nr:hypothetical protein BS47DRAFT_1342288 [Hydnum rufescens UP504]